MTISRELLDEMLKGVERPEDLLRDSGLMKELEIKRRERKPSAELTADLGYEEGKKASPALANGRNIASTELPKRQGGKMSLAVPRDRDNSFEPKLVKKGQTWIDGKGVRRMRKQRRALFSRRSRSSGSVPPG